MELTKRAEAAEALSREAEKSVWIAKFETERRTEMRSILSDVFRNAEVLRTVSRNVPFGIPAGGQNMYPTTVTGMETGTETEQRR